MTFADLSWYDGSTRLLLILGNPVYPSAQSRFVTLPLYSAGSRHQTRLARVDDPCAYYHHLLHAVDVWQDLFLEHRPQPSAWHSPIHIPLNHDFHSHIHIPEHRIKHLLPPLWGDTIIDIANPDLPWSGSPPLTITYGLVRDWKCGAGTIHDITLVVGKCTSSQWHLNHPSASEACSYWVRVKYGGLDQWTDEDLDHVCPTDHILEWQDLKREYSLCVFSGDESPGRPYIWALVLGFSLDTNKDRLTLTESSGHLRTVPQ